MTVRRRLNFVIITGFQLAKSTVRRILPLFFKFSACLTLAGMASAESVVVSDWQPWDSLPESEKSRIAPYCSGGFVAYAIDTEQEETRFRFNSASYSDDQNALFEGDVVIYTPGAEAEADRVSYVGSTQMSELHGDVSIHIPQVGLSSTQATISLENYYALLNDAEFVLHDQDMHGTANQLERQNEQVFIANNVRFTRCGPDSNAWHIAASKLIIDNEKNVATAWNPRLEIQNIPVLYVPYISFPLNDQPRTGLLIPSFGSGVSVPYYLHLAPNYDDTFTLDYGGDKGLFARNEFRFLFEEHNGVNQFDYRITEPKSTDDSAASGEQTTSRWSVIHNQSGVLAGFGYDFSTRWVSDQNIDIALNPGTKDPIDYHKLNFSLNRPLFGFNNKLTWAYTQPVIDSAKTLESLGTTLTSSRKNLTLTALTQGQRDFDNDDKDTQLSEYALLKKPELQVDYKNHALPLGVIAHESAKYTKFQRDLPNKLRESLTGSNQNKATQANRQHSSIILSRPFKHSDWYFTPTIEGYASHYKLNNDLGYDLNTLYGNDEFTQLSWRGSLDQGFTIKSTQNRWQHSLSPRLYYAYAPLQEQNAPIQEGEFNNSFALFTTSRFSGTDRIADLQRLSTSLTYELKADGKTRFILGTKKGVKLADERMRTAPNQLTQNIDTENWQPEYGDWNVNTKIIPSDVISFTGDLSYRHDWQQLTSFNATLAYQPGKHEFATLSLGKANGTEVNSDDTKTEGVFHNIKLGAYLPVMQNIGLIGYGKAQAFTPDANFKTNTVEVLSWDDFKLNEMLVGIDYDACCWNLRLAVMDISVDEVSNQRSLFPVNTDRKYFFEFTLKGIGAGFGTIEGILQRLDFGYSSRLFNYR